MDALSLRELEAQAEKRLPAMAWGYYASGADDQRTLTANAAAYSRIPIYYRVLAGVSEVDLATEILGASIAMPIAVAPTAFHGLACEDAELASARAAHAAGTRFVLSTLSNTPVEEVARVCPDLWFQLYVYRDRAVTEDLVRRVEAAGCKALVLTVDAPVLGRREADVRNRFHLPDGLGLQNLVAAGMEGLPRQAAESGLAAYFASLIDPALAWSDLDWLRGITSLPIVVKGVVRRDDAARAAAAGVSALWVSNHGGRQLDTSPATIDALPGVVEGADGRCEIYLDGGVRRGTDVVKALARGARAVFVGRPVLWGLATGGQQGVASVLGMLREELERAMLLAGCGDVRAVTAELLG